MNPLLKINKKLNSIATKYKKLISCIKSYMDIYFPNKYNFTYKTQKYTFNMIFASIIDFIKSGSSYHNYVGIVNSKTLNFHVNFFARNFDSIYTYIYNKYQHNIHTIKHLSIDTSFIGNKYGSQFLGRNKYFKNKRGYKLSLLIDNKGIANSILIRPGNLNDKNIGIEHLNKINFISKLNRNAYMLADKGYDSNDFKTKCKMINCQPLIAQNKRNIKDTNKFVSINKSLLKIYKKRILVENIFARIKKYNRINYICDSYFTYVFYVYLALCITTIYKYL